MSDDAWEYLRLQSEVMSQLAAAAMSTVEFSATGVTFMKNNSPNVFTDISSEAWREYKFKDATVYIELPTQLSVSASGGHRILDAAGISHYIPSGWYHLCWEAKPDAPNFVK